MTLKTLLTLSILALAPLQAQIVVIAGSDTISASRTTINNNFAYLDTYKLTNPLTTRGDLIAQGASAASRLVIGSANKVLVTNGTDPSWALIVNANITNATIDLTTKVTDQLRGTNGGLGADASAFTGLLKMTAGIASVATAGTDYSIATNGTTGQALVSNGAGGFGTALTLAASATTNALNASNISSGTLLAARLPSTAVTAAGLSANAVPLASAAATLVDSNLTQDGSTGQLSASKGLNGPFASVTYSTTPVFNLANGNALAITLTGNVSSSTLTNIKAGVAVLLRFCQDSSGSHTVVLPTNLLNVGTVYATASTCTNYFGWAFDTSNVYVISSVVTGATGSAIVFAGSSSGSTVLQPAAAAAGTITLPAISGTHALGAVVARGTSALGTSTVNANSCATLVTTSATGTLTTDAIIWTPNADISAAGGYSYTSTDGLKVYPYPSADNVNFKVCNGTASNITSVGAVTLNWVVLR